jgi:D-alanyl-D-alanine carboxypeptidase (penicillin-binding protein 5/6)
VLVAALLTWSTPLGAAQEAPEGSAPAAPGAETPAEPSVPSAAPLLPPGVPPLRAAIVVDAGTGRVLLGDNYHERLRPASTAKIMTALTAVERLAPDATIEVDDVAAAAQGQSMYLPAGTTLSLDDALAALLLVSANDVAYAVANTVSGSLAAFADDLNETAQRFGMHDSMLNDPSGLDTESSFGGGPYMSAFDLAIAARNALAVPMIARWAATREHTFTDSNGVQRPLDGHNMLLPGDAYSYEGANGLKTGFTT